jgi:hypothetical protein
MGPLFRVRFTESPIFFLTTVEQMLYSIWNRAAEFERQLSAIPGM